MASLVYRRGNRKVYVYYTDKKTGKTKQLPRAYTKHLDGKPQAEAEAWLAEWMKKNGISRDRIDRVSLKAGDALLGLWQRYQEFKASDTESGRRERTIETESQLFHNHIVPFFVGKHQKKNPVDWHPLVPDFHLHLNSEGLSIRYRAKILWLLKRFGESLVFSQHMSFPYAIRPPKGRSTKVTPLKVRKTPDEIIKYVKNTTFEAVSSRKYEGSAGQIAWGLAILLGYFGGFGPGELFALEKTDFLTGKAAEKECKTYKGFKKKKLGSHLSVVINKTLPAIGEDTVPLVKNDYRYGVSNIWNVEAAHLISALVRNRPEGRLFPFSYAYLIRRWREQVTPTLGTTPHDLRRASALYLGRTLHIGAQLLQKHMRHADYATTQLYTREPAVPEAIKAYKQNFDDVD